MHQNSQRQQVRAAVAQSWGHEALRLLEEACVVLGWKQEGLEITTFGISRFKDDQIKRVEAALKEHGVDAKVDVIYRASRPMRRSTCLDIRNHLLNEGSRN